MAATTEVLFIREAERWIEDNFDDTFSFFPKELTFSFFPKEQLDLKRQKQLLIQCVIPKFAQRGFRCRLMSVQESNYIDLTLIYDAFEHQSPSCTVDGAANVDTVAVTIPESMDAEHDDAVEKEDDADEEDDDDEEDEDDDDGSRTITMNDIENDLALMEKEKDVLNLLIGTSNATPPSNDLEDLCFCADCRSARG